MRVVASVIGHFGEGKTLLNGQTVKTKIVTEELEKRFGADQVVKFDTHGGPKTLLKAPFQVLFALKNSTNVLVFPAHNGLRVYAPLMSFFKRFYKKTKIHYVVIGGWLPEFLQEHKSLVNPLKRFDGIYVETNKMKQTLEAQGFENVLVLQNCKKLTVLSQDELVYPEKEPYKLCTFSRVMCEKGIEDAVNAVKSINKEMGRTVYTLDIYGQVDAGQTEWFENLQKMFSEEIRYGGLVPFDKSVEVLKDYFALLFPTRFYTEGIPGTIIDAYAAGIPVISAKWENFSDIVEDGVTGFGYEFENISQFEKILQKIAQEPTIILEQKANCIKRVEKYVPEFAIRSIIDQF